MPSAKRNWCVHPSHLETLPNGKKIFKKVGPKPNHPLGSRRLSLTLCDFINRTCRAIVNNPALKLNDNQSLCTKCYNLELNRYEESIDEDLCLNTQRMGIHPFFGNIANNEDVNNSPNLADIKQQYSIEKLNEVFKLFQIEPVVM